MPQQHEACEFIHWLVLKTELFRKKQIIYEFGKILRNESKRDQTNKSV